MQTDKKLDNLFRGTYTQQWLLLVLQQTLYFGKSVGSGEFYRLVQNK